MMQIGRHSRIRTWDKAGEGKLLDYRIRLAFWVAVALALIILW